MGMGSAPAHAWVISLENLRGMLPVQVKVVEDTFLPVELDWDEFARSIDHDLTLSEDNERATKVLAAWEQLQAAFEHATQTDWSKLSLEIGWYDRESGDRYDDLENGAYFYVEGMTCLSPAGERFQNKIDEKAWTVFG